MSAPFLPPNIGESPIGGSGFLSSGAIAPGVEAGQQAVGDRAGRLTGGASLAGVRIPQAEGKREQRGGGSTSVRPAPATGRKDFYSEHTVTGRGRYVCTHCGKWIEKGVRHVSVARGSGGEIGGWRAHIACHTAAAGRPPEE